MLATTLYYSQTFLNKAVKCYPLIEPITLPERRISNVATTFARIEIPVSVKQEASIPATIPDTTTDPSELIVMGILRQAKYYTAQYNFSKNFNFICMKVKLLIVKKNFFLIEYLFFTSCQAVSLTNFLYRIEVTFENQLLTNRKI